MSSAGMWLGAVSLLAVTVSGCTREVVRPRPVSDAATHRDTAFGPVVGFQNEYGSHAWLGIPYAAPPIKDLRWRAPRKPAKWTGTLEALSFGSPCVQYASRIGGVPGKPGDVVGSEDCLSLSIWAPAMTAGEARQQRLPVMLWIHGGGNTIGQSGFYNGGNLAASQQVVVVAINYRLGPFGWFRHASLREDDTTPAEQSGNFALLDMIAALEWVRDNIAGFGGDPQKVTIFGESAGGTNVYSLLLAPQARGLFHRAIAQSGGFFFSTPEQAESFTDAEPPGDTHSSSEVLLRLIQRDKIRGDRTGAKEHLALVRLPDVARYLRNKSAAEILSAYEPTPLGMIRMPTVTSDGTVIPQGDPLERFHRSDGYNQVPFMAGTNRDENKLFLFADPNLVRRWFWVIPRLRDERMYNLTAEYLSRMWKARGADEPAAAMRGAQGPSVFVYRFDWDEEPTVLGADLSVMLGAAHGFEIPFVFGHFDLGREGNMIFTEKNEPGRKELSQAMMSYWAQFAADGNPGRGRDGQQPEWLPWDDSGSTSPKYLVLDTRSDGGVRMSGDSITRTRLLDELARDNRLTTPKERCAIYRGLAEWSRGLTRKQYDALPDCQAYPYEKFPW